MSICTVSTKSRFCQMDLTSRRCFIQTCPGRTDQGIENDVCREHITELQSMKAMYATNERVTNERLLETSERLLELNAHVTELCAEIPKLKGQVSALKSEMAAEISFGLHDLATQQFDTH